MKTRDPWRVVRPMGRPQTFRTREDAETYAAMNGGIVESTERHKPEREPGASKATDEIPPDVRAAVRRRSGGRCEIRSEGCSGTAQHMHHRLKRAHGVHTPENIVDSCWDCHTASPAALHRNVGWARRVGLLIDSWDPPPSEAWSRDRLACPECGGSWVATDLAAPRPCPGQWHLVPGYHDGGSPRG